MRWLVFIPPVLFLALAIAFYTGMQRDNPSELPSTLIGQKAPALNMASLGDKDIFTNDDLQKPGVKLVNFWASWCAPCRVEHPNLALLQKEGIPIYGVNYKDNPANALQFLGDLGNPYKALGAIDRIPVDWGVSAVPETFVLDGNGTIIARLAGPITAQELDRVIRPALLKAQK